MSYSKKLIRDEFTERKVSRQYKWQLRRKRDGQCIQCGKPRELFASFCKAHGIRARILKRKSLGLKAWKPGKGGKIPMEMRTAAQGQTK